MAIFHLSVKTVSRSAGRSATAAAAYRAGVEITDIKTGEVHNYRRRKSGIESADLFLPAGAPKWATDRAELWNAAEKSETRKNSTVAREFEVALPAELSADQRRELAHDFTKALVKKYGFAADCAIHLPGKNGDSQNHHAHILCSTRKLTAEGFTAKTRELDDRATGAEQVVEVRELFAHMTNVALERAGHSARVDHRSLEDQGIDRDAGIHLGPSATAIERRGEVSEKTMHQQERQQEAEAKVAAMVAIAEAQAKAQAEQLAINTKLAADAAKEKEDDGIRKAALAAIARSSAATGRALGFIKSDHAEIERALDGSREHLIAAQSVTRRIGSNTGSIARDSEIAAQGAQRRVARSYLASCAPAVRKQLSNACHVLQHIVVLIPDIVSTIAAAARQVAARTILLNAVKKLAPAKAPEQPQQAAPEQTKGNIATQPEKLPMAVLEPSLKESDRKLIARLDDAIDRAANGDQKAMDSLAKAFDELDAARRESASAYRRAMPQPFHRANAEKDAERAQEIAAERDVNAQAVARGVTAAVPYPPGTWGVYAQEHYSSYETALKKATNELVYHQREPRPTGFFKKKETAAYDAKAVDLQRKVTVWEREIGWRDAAFRAAIKAREPSEAEHVAMAKAAYDRAHAPTIEKAEPLRARSEAHEREHARLREKIERVFDEEKQHDLNKKERDRGIGYER